MEFREATEKDFEFAAQHSLHKTGGKDQPDRIDFGYTLDHGDYILAVGGFRLITDTTAWAWIELTEYVGSHLIPTCRVISEWAEIFCRDHNIRRLQAWVPKGFEEGMRMVRHFGFEAEFLMKDFLGKGQDAMMFVRFFDGE